MIKWDKKTVFLNLFSTMIELDKHLRQKKSFKKDQRTSLNHQFSSQSAPYNRTLFQFSFISFMGQSSLLEVLHDREPLYIFLSKTFQVHCQFWLVPSRPSCSTKMVVQEHFYGKFLQKHLIENYKLR